MQYSRQKPRLLFLYSELADYFLACIKKLLSVHDVDVYIIHWPVNKEAPFKFVFPEGVRSYDRKQFDAKSLKEKIKEIAPDFIYCSGWLDTDYLYAVRGYKNKIPVVIGLDTKWTGTARQYLACVLSRFTLLSMFSHCWVPGQSQKKYALKLGFRQSDIRTGYYSADTDYFKALGERAELKKKTKYPHKLIFAGRYYTFKGVTDLWNAFIQLQKEKESDWELWCLGVGDIEPVKHPKIRHFGFVQPKDMMAYIGETGVFVMPSLVEPWGVVLHEFAAAGFPLIASDAVGSVEAFIADGQNGYIYTAGDVEELKKSIEKITSRTDNELRVMGKRSVEMAMKITPEIWANTLMQLIDKK